jgi:polysaccharide deacetylase 2 family uncharacterized protein YibQ
MRGFLAGAGTGLVVAGVGLSALSLMAPQPAGNRPPDAPQVEAPAEVPDAAAAMDAVPEAAVAAVAEQGGGPSATLAQGEPPVPPVEGSAPVADTAPADVPALDAAADALSVPPADTAPASVAVAADAPPEGTGAGVPAPTVPAPETDVVAATAPAQPVEIVPQAEPQSEPDAGPEAGPDTLVAAPSESAPAPEAETAAERLPETEVAGAEQPAVTAVASDLPEVTEESAPDLPASPGEIAPPAADEEVAEAEVRVSPGLPGGGNEGAALPQIGVEDEALPALPDDPVTEQVALPGANGEAGLPGAESGVRVNRPAAEPAPDAALAVPALVRFAAAWEGPDLPRMGLVLVDGGGLDGGQPGAAAAAVAALPLAVAVAIDPARDGAGAAMAAYRAAGIEVLALARLPEGAAPTDVAVVMEGARAALPEAVALVDTGAGGLQEGREVAAQVMARLSGEGMGVILPGGGIGGAAAAATEAGVPLAEIWREIPPEADAAAIRRLLDQGAFRARQESGVVLVGEIDAETVSALMLWGATRAAEQVAVAPVSVILRGE